MMVEISFRRFILKQRESLACSPLNYGGVATVVIRYTVLLLVFLAENYLVYRLCFWGVAKG